MWMVIYAHPLCTYILLNVYVLYIRNFLHKSVDVFDTLSSQTTPSAKTTAASAYRETNKDHSRRQRRPGSPGLNLSTMRPRASRARRCPVSRWQAGRATGKWVRQGLHIQYPLKVFIQRGSPASLGCRLINSGWGVSDVTGVPPQLGICLFIAVLESKVVYMRS